MANENAQYDSDSRQWSNDDREGQRPRDAESNVRSAQSGALRAGVLGINDGLVTNLSLVMGVAGGTSGGHSSILLAGIAGLLAGSFSMAAGEYVSMQSQKDVYRAGIMAEREEVENNPKRSARRLAKVYRDKGLPERQAAQFASRIMSDPDEATETKAKEELGLDPEDLGSPWRAAGSSYLSFTIGAVIPIIPFIFGAGVVNMVWSWLFGAAALGFVGGGLAWMSKVNIGFGAARMLVIGLAAAGATYGIGHVLGGVIG